METESSRPNGMIVSTRDASTSSATSLSQRWRQLLDTWLKEPIVNLLKFVARQSAKRPVYVVALISFCSFGLLMVGSLTGFTVETATNQLWAPIGSYPIRHHQWITHDSGFPDPERRFVFLIHRTEFGNMLQDNEVVNAGISRVFDVMDTLTSIPGYAELCSLSDWGYCRELSVASFWSGSRDSFESTAAAPGPGSVAGNVAVDKSMNETVMEVLSRKVFPSGQSVVRSTIFGSPTPLFHTLRESDNSNDENTAEGEEDYRQLTGANSFLGMVSLPSVDEEMVLEWESLALNALLTQRDQWDDENDEFRLELLATRSFDDEFNRAIVQDIPLFAMVFLVMGLFCCLALFRESRPIRGPDRCYRRVLPSFSQAVTGLGALFSVIFALAGGYGALFCLRVPFTSLTQIFPFILMGIGLDDAFIITGAMARLDVRLTGETDREEPPQSVEHRIGLVMEESGLSIFVATLTTFLAFLGGSTTTIPAVRWFCWYAATCVALDFIYQISFFVAILALKERWESRNNCKNSSTEGQAAERSNGNEGTNQREGSWADRLMAKYADFLLLPLSKVFVLLTFLALLVVGAVRASHLTQHFSFFDLTPSNSYVDSYFAALDETSTEGESDVFMMQGSIYFRDVDFSKEEVQTAMDQYVTDIAKMNYVSYPPASFWLNDYRNFQATQKDQNLTTFEDGLDKFLKTSPYRELYLSDIARDEEGVMTASRTFFQYDRVDRSDVKEQTDALLEQRAITRSQPINKNQDNWKFFTFSDFYDVWEFYNVVVDELIWTTAVSLAAVTFVSILFLPPAGCLIVVPIVGIVYVELLGVLQIAGLFVNSVTSIGVVMSIGLVVDYSMHIVVAFFSIEETAASLTRDEKVRQVLGSMGASVAMGGFTTLLGVLPLSLSTSQVFWTFFIIFLGIVFLGLGHGLVLLPILLSLFGGASRSDSRAPHASSNRDTDERVRKQVETKCSTDHTDRGCSSSDSMEDEETG